MKASIWAVGVFLALFAVTGAFCQTEGGAPPAEGTPDSGAATAPDSGGSAAEKRRQDDTVRALMGEADHPASKKSKNAGGKKTKSGAADKGAATGSRSSKSSDTGGSSRSRSGSSSAPTPASDVPEVPASPPPDASAVPPPPSAVSAEPAPASTTPPPASMDNYRTPAPAPPPEAANTEAANAAPAGAPPSSSPASAIVIGLIVLAILLVALAAVVGVAAAHRSHPEGAALAAAPATGWAYLAAPNAPNISLQKSPFLIGSSISCDLRLADPKASPQHARIDRTPEGYVLYDLSSTNGTFLNGERIASPVSLRPGDEVQMGDIVVTFEIYV